MSSLTFGSLFSGIGGFDLAFERAGMRCLWQVEIDEKCRQVLARHWPDVTRYEDINDVGKHNLEAVDVICGGFPCQDISAANTNGRGLDGERSGLWREFGRVIGELRPRYVLVENTANLLARGIDRVLGTLAALGYDAEWEVISACALGAPHMRERVFILAYAERPEWWALGSARCNLDNAHHGLHAGREEDTGWATVGYHQMDGGAWATEPAVGRVANGVPDRMDRLTQLGNAVVPQVAEWIGRQLMEALR